MKRSLLLLMICCLIHVSYATDGFFNYGYGTYYKGFAGGGIALYRSSLVSANNPAGLVFVGKMFDVSLAFFMPTRQYTISGSPSGYPGTFPLSPGTVESENNFFLVPSLGANWMINEKSSIGVSVFANGGLNTEYNVRTYDNPMAGVTSPTGINLILVFGTVTYSRKINDNHAFGVSLVSAFKSFEATGLQAFAGLTSDPNALTNNGSDNTLGLGFKLGYAGKLTEGLSFGAAYQSKINSSGFENYRGLFAGGGNFDIPSNFTVGVAYKVNPVVTLVADYKKIMYSNVNSIGNPLNLAKLSPVMSDGVTPNSQYAPLGSDDAAGFGWKDMTIYKVGAEFTANKDWSFRTGFSYGKQPIPDTEVLFNIMAPGVIESHASIGATRKIGNKELNLAMTYAFNNTLKGANPLEAPGQQEIELQMSQVDIEIGFSF